MKKVMIIEDDPAILDVLAIIFNRAGYTVSPYANGDFIFQGGFEIPDLFIIDKQLSGVDGLDICKHLRSLPPTSHLPIIVFSATPHQESQIKQAGANVFLEKPFNNNDLLQIANNLIDGS
jgi:CheY-like chemotaxis protein